MKKLKIWSIILLVVVMIPIVVLCGGDDDNDDNSLPFTKELLVDEYSFGI